MNQPSKLHFDRICLLWLVPHYINPQAAFAHTSLHSNRAEKRLYRVATIALLLLLSFSPLSSGCAQNAEIRSFVIQGHLNGMRWTEFKEFRKSLFRFYEPVSFEPAWTINQQPTPASQELIQIFQHADKKGLDPEAYDASRWDARLNVLRRQPSEAAVARFDVALSVCALRYLEAVSMGRIPPKALLGNTPSRRPSFDLVQILREEIVTSHQVDAAISAIEPDYAAYRRTENALAHYIKLAQQDDSQRLPAVRRPVELGQQYAGVQRLARILTLLGDLPQLQHPNPGSQIYDTSLANAVRQFQRRHGLEVDGRLGKETIEQLNVPLKQRVLQLQLSLERWRWLPHELPTPSVFVNIPDFRLRAVDSNLKVVLDMRVVVGNAMRTQTPVFYAEMTRIIFRPYWIVPQSIAIKEIVPIVQHNSHYLTENHFEIIDTHHQKVSCTECAEELRQGLQSGNWRLRQQPGGDNALGLVKFEFPNDNNVYLHDTPAARLFRRTRRDFSHGCIRLESPVDLAVWALANNSGWTRDRVIFAMTEGMDNIPVPLTIPIPVFIVYGTAIAYEGDVVHFSKDIYGFDSSLSTALQKGYPYRSSEL